MIGALEAKALKISVEICRVCSDCLPWIVDLIFHEENVHIIVHIVYKKLVEMQTLNAFKIKIVWWGLGTGSMKIDSLELTLSYADVWPDSLGPTS